ncbi:hypothetical protein [Sphingobium tyrosinilyticum]|uniref:HTH tetR-type domain-containing protein n=1 Tax=Sphingobium tyrosinilyticum TaxID=2715436 RepID=A0ABV9F2X8_9SPHN
MLAEDGYRSFTIKNLSQRTKSSPQTLHNNIGSKGDIIFHAIVNYNRLLISKYRPIIGNDYIGILAARHLTIKYYPDYSRSVYSVVEGDNYVNMKISEETIKVISKLVRSSLSGLPVREDGYISVSRVIAAAARTFVKEWINGSCDIYEMTENSIEGAELCILGAASRCTSAWRPLSAWAEGERMPVAL